MVKNIIIIGIDGVGRAVFDPRCKNINKFLEKATIFKDAMTVFPPISAQAWGSLLLSVSPDKHEYTNDYIKANQHAVDDLFPSIYRLILENKKDYQLTSICNWNPINYGIIEPFDVIQKKTGDSDEEITQKVVNHIQSDREGLLFIHLDEMDEAGHEHDYFSEKYMNTLPEMDTRVGRMLDAIEEHGQMDESLIFLVTDHGGGAVAKKHGQNDIKDMGIFIAISGPSYEKGKVSSEHVNIMDIAPTVLNHLEIEIPDYMEGKILKG